MNKYLLLLKRPASVRFYFGKPGLPLMVFLICLCYQSTVFAKTVGEHNSKKVPNTVAGIISPTFTVGAITGNISACAGTASISPHLLQFTISGTGLSAGVSVAASVDFEVSLSPATGYSGIVTAPQTGGTLSNTLVYIRSSSSAPAGIIQGHITITTAGAANQSFEISGNITAVPTVSPVTNQTVTGGSAIVPVSFTQTGNTLHWTNNTPAIGLAASGYGNIGAFVSLNPGTTPVVATVTATSTNANLAYIPNSSTGNVSVVSTLSNKIVATIPVGSSPGGITFSADGSTGYVANAGSNNVSVINTASNSVIATTMVGNYPIGLALSTDDTRLYVANALSSSISVINTATNTVIATIPSIKSPTALAVSPDGSKLYVASADGILPAVIVINTSDNTVVTSVFVGYYPYGLAISTDGSHLYVASESTNSVEVMNTATNTVTATIQVGTQPNGIALTPDGSKVYVTNGGTNNVSVISTATNTVTATIQVGANPAGISITPDGLHAYEINTNSNNVSEINTATNTISATVNVGMAPVAIGNFIRAGTGCTSAPVSFTITVNPAPPSANLSGLVLSTGTLSPVFASGTIHYTASVPYTTTSITVTPTTSNANATVKVNNIAVATGTASSPITLNVGANTITAIVTGHDGVTTKTYTVTVTRTAPSTNCFLTSITLHPGATLTTTTGPGFRNYTATESNATTSITVKAIAQDANASIKINNTAVASGVASGPIALAVGQNTVTIVVTAQDGVSTKTFIITVTRLPSTVATLSGLQVTGEALTPAFASGITRYSALVPLTTASATVKPTVTHAGATVNVDGVAVASGTVSGPIALNIGPNPIPVVVTAQDGTTTDTYNITIYKGNHNAYLSNLQLSSGTLSPVFHYTTAGYTATVTNATSSITVKPTVADPTATIRVNERTVASGTPSGAINLVVGANTIQVVVTAQNGTTSLTYTITVTRAAAGMNIPDETISVAAPTDAPTIEDDVLIAHQGVSPNGDGVNDFFVIDGILAYPDNKLNIVDRSGNLVFEAKGYDNTSRVFDGHSSKTGAMQRPGTYFFSLDYMVKGIAKHKTGFIILKY